MRAANSLTSAGCAGSTQLLHVACLKWRQPTVVVVVGGTVVLLGLGARLAATLNCLDRSGTAAETSIKLGLTPPNLSGRRRIIFRNVWHLCGCLTSNPACCVRQNVSLLFILVAKQKHCSYLNDRSAYVEVCVAFIAYSSAFLWMKLGILSFVFQNLINQYQKCH